MEEAITLAGARVYKDNGRRVTQLRTLVYSGIEGGGVESICTYAYRGVFILDNDMSVAANSSRSSCYSCSFVIDGKGGGVGRLKHIHARGGVRKLKCVVEFHFKICAPHIIMVDFCASNAWPLCLHHVLCFYSFNIIKLLLYYTCAILILSIIFFPRIVRG